jgi:hypothetical protein
MFSDGGLDSQNETVPVASSVITNTRNEVDIQILQLSRARTELRTLSPKPADVFDDDDAELSSAGASQKILIAGPVGGASADSSI